MMMTESLFTYVAFAAVCLLFLTLPFVPAVREWLRPTDVDALPVSANYTNDIDHFARRLHADVSAKLGLGTSTGYEEFDYVADVGENMAWDKADKRLIARDGIDTGDAIRCAQPLYVSGDMQAGEKSSFTALYATGNIGLGDGSEIHDWAHADGILRLGKDAMAIRRLSAGVAIELEKESWFERMHAPTLRFGTGLPARSLPLQGDAEKTQASYADLPDAIEQTPRLFLIRGDCALPAGSIYRGSLVVTGFLTIGAGTTVVGDIKAREGLSIGNGASVQGAVTCEKSIYVFKNARALGPVVSETDILIGTHAVIGLPDAHTTVSAGNIIVEEGVLVHGTVWAHEIGMVKAA